MIQIQTSNTADTRSCDPAAVTKDDLLESSQQHIEDVVKGMAFLVGMLVEAAGKHDADKLTLIDWFHSDFLTKFEEHGWWDNHRRINRHHLTKDDGIPGDVNLLDVLEYVVDCVMAGKARNAAQYYSPELPSDLLVRAFTNTVSMLEEEVVVAEPSRAKGGD